MKSMRDQHTTGGSQRQGYFAPDGGLRVSDGHPTMTCEDMGVEHATTSV